MSVCPQCKTKWNDAHEVCPQCGCTLWCVHSMQNGSKEIVAGWEKNPYEPVFLMQSTDEQEVELIERLLQAERIPFFTRDLESGEYMRIYMGCSIFGKQIYVRAKDYAICEPMLSAMAGEYDDRELEAAYEKYMQETANKTELESDVDMEQTNGNYRMLLGFFVFFTALIIWMLLVSGKGNVQLGK